MSNEFLNSLSPLSDKASYIPQKKSGEKKYRYDFSHDATNSSLFPWKLWRQYVNNALIEEENKTSIQYESNKGNLELRKALCLYLNRSRGVICDPEQLILVPGTQYAMEIILRLIPTEFKNVASEEPSHNAMRSIFIQNGFKLTPVPVLENGIDVDRLYSSDCNLLYVMPSHQFPTGKTIPVSNRLRLLEWAVRHNTYIIENDYDSEFNYHTQPIPSLQSLDRYGHVIYFDTLSKVLTPSLRTAFFVLPYPLLEKYETMYKYFNSSLPSFNQTALAEFIESGDFEKHLRRIIRTNEKKSSILTKSINLYLSKYAQIIDNPAGSHIIVKIKDCTNQDELIEKLKKYDIKIYGVKQYYHNIDSVPEDVFLLGFNSLTEEDIPVACKKLCTALDHILFS